jgi:acyl-CoA synthetase (AMP-forming)/AMP-acid ligase II/thioesterase domain-containing protein
MIQRGTGRVLLRFLQLERRATELPHAVALLSPGREPLTYSHLWTLLESAAEALRGSGLRPGEAVALVTAQGPEFITAFLALAGEFACAPLNPSLTAAEYRLYLSRLGARTLLIEDGVASPAVATADELGMRVMRIRPARDRTAGAFGLDSAGGSLTARTGRQTDAALLLFTSATTGDPKLVPLTASNLHAIAEQDSRAQRLGEEDRLLTLMPLFHGHGLCSALAALFCGGSVVLPPGFETDGLLNWLDEFRPTWFTAAPPFLNTILTLALREPEPFRRAPLRFIRSSVAPLKPDLRALLEETVRAPVLEGYGMTEAVALTRSSPDARKPGSVGRTTGAEIAIMDESGNLLPPETEGEIVVRGANVMRGYLDDPEANRLAFRNGWFRSGDLGRFDNEGFLYITGRLKEMINRGGHKIAPKEVDEALARHPAVAEAAAFAIPHRTLGEDVAAAVVLREGASVSEADLRRFATANLAPFKAPHRIVFVDHIPRVATGKPQRSALEKQYRDLPAHACPFAMPLTAMERRLTEVWSRILQVSEIGREDDFFNLGGDSLSVALMLTEVQTALSSNDAVRFDHIDFFDQPTIASLARILIECGARFEPQETLDWGGCRIVSFRERGSGTPLFCFPASERNPYYLRHLPNCLPDRPFHVVCPPGPVNGNRLMKMEELARLSLAAVRSIQPRGPYLLGGHCYGGVIAFEAARQLQSVGEQITRLLLFDVPAPGYPKVARSWRRYLKESLPFLQDLARGKGETRHEVLRHLRWLKRIFFRRVGGRASRALSAVGSDALLAGRERRELNGMTLGEYVPAALTAPIVHFIAKDEPVSTKVLDDPRFAWREFALGGLELRTVAGDHNSLFTADHAPALAAQLEPLLR